MMYFNVTTLDTDKNSVEFLPHRLAVGIPFVFVPSYIDNDVTEQLVS